MVRMMLRIDERDLRSKLNEHRSLIGYGSKGDGIANIVAGLFYIPTAWTFAELPMWARCLFAVLGVVIIGDSPRFPMYANWLRAEMRVPRRHPQSRTPLHYACRV